VAGTGLGCLLLAACGGGLVDPLANPASGASTRAGEAVVVGSSAATESTVLAELYAQAITARGVEAVTKLNTGSREVYLRALQEGSISVVPEYTGNLLLSFDPSTTATTAEEVEQALPAALPSGLTLGNPSPAANQDVYVVTKAYSDATGVRSLEDLKKVAADVVLGGPPDLESRAYGPGGLAEVYGAQVKQFKPDDSADGRARDLDDGSIQLGEFLSTEVVIPAPGYVVLADPQAMILPQNIVPLYRADVAADARVTAAVDAVQQALTTEELAALNAQVDVDSGVSEVARGWLRNEGLG
jgi:osmoprotectant transport system substrate-binding protein